jgi:uncharacterized membrane protein YqaE (UPF0057 family)
MWGTSYTNVPFLTGFYNGSFNPEMGSDQAAQFSSLAMVVAFITPFFTALLADGLFGDYSTILILMTCFSLPGLILMVLAAWPGLLSSVFGKLNQDVMRVGMLIFYPIGNGGMNTLNNIFSAKQYHPELQKDLIERVSLDNSIIFEVYFFAYFVARSAKSDYFFHTFLPFLVVFRVGCNCHRMCGPYRSVGYHHHRCLQLCGGTHPSHCLRIPRHRLLCGWAEQIRST